MRRLQCCLLASSLLFGGVGLFVRGADAQVSQVTPIPLPPPEIPLAVPDGTQITSDPHAGELLFYLVELSRKFGGGILQTLSALSGPKSFPVFNGPQEIAARRGGPGLWEMANAALSGAMSLPDGVQAALNEFRQRYHLGDVFALKDDKLDENKIIAQLGAQGAIAASTAEDSYKRANMSMDHLNGYITALQDSPDLKTSIDINTRVMIEVAQQINEQLRAQAALASVAGTYFMALSSDAASKDGFDLTDFNRD